jgi:hypothetical protein
MDVTDFLQLFFYGEAIPILLSVTTRMETDSVKIEFHKKPDCLENLAPITRAYAQNHSQKGARFSTNPTFYLRERRY